MDRLQVAIEKARAQRAEVLKNSPPSVGPLRQDGAEPDVAPVPEAPAAGPWEALQPVDLKARQLRNHRLMSMKGGPSAVPYDVLRTRMLQQVRQNNWRYIGIVSPTSECGKTTAAVNLAFSLSRQPDVRTILLDFDLRRPRLAKMMGQKIQHGMEAVLKGEVAFAEHARRLGDNVAIGYNSGPARNPSELLQSKMAAQKVAEMVETYDPTLVLFDLPPMMATDDNFGFLTKVDAVLLMVAAEQTTMEQIEVTLRQLKDLTNVLGIALNKCRHVGGTYGYGTKYHYY